MHERKLLILNEKQISQKIDRMAYQVLEDNLHETDLVIAGIVDHGYTIAKRLKKVIEKISDIKITLMKIELDKTSTHLKADTDFTAESVQNKVIILVDDVLNSGR